jgi:hypothetical protein
MESNKEIAEAMRKKADELFNFDLIPSYSVTKDEFGEISDIKRNPPKFKLV